MENRFSRMVEIKSALERFLKNGWIFVKWGNDPLRRHDHDVEKVVGVPVRRKDAILQRSLDAFFPRFCLGCHKEGTLWCVSCTTMWWPISFASTCPFCQKAGSRTCASCRAETFLDGLSVFASYANPVVREAILQWKYIGDRAVEPVIEQWLIRAAPLLTPVRSDSVFAPVPLHIRKRQARGFDQAGLMADWYGQIFHRPVYDLLIRKQMTVPQAKQKKGERTLGQLDGIFMMSPFARDVPKSVVLCDDVFTSGATMDAAAKCLKQAGVEWVWGLVLAKGNP